MSKRNFQCMCGCIEVQEAEQEQKRTLSSLRRKEKKLLKEFQEASHRSEAETKKISDQLREVHGKIYAQKM